MCGIAGYIGSDSASSVLLKALDKLKYRGYDSSGVAIINDTIQVCKAAGKLNILINELTAHPLIGTVGIAHTRWATHGEPTKTNAHPHTNNVGTISVVHNGIIENYETLRNELIELDYVFTSQTDTEVIPHMLSRYYQGDPVEAVRLVVNKLKGSFAFAAIFSDHPRRIIVARNGSPLLIGIGKSEILVASDIHALLPLANQVCYLDDGTIADLSDNKVELRSFSNEILLAQFKPIEINVEEISKGTFDKFKSAVAV